LYPGDKKLLKNNSKGSDPMHKRIGILGGMSPASTVEYYTYITREYTRRYGDYAYPEILIHSVTFQPYVDWPNAGQWDKVAAGLGEAARGLQRAGADFILIATNTMHIVFDQVQAQVDVPMLSLLDAVGAAIAAQGCQTVGLLGTRFTMQSDLYPAALVQQGVEVIVPEAEDIQFVNRVIYEELVAGEIRPQSRAGFKAVIERLAARGAQGIILGCTEIPLIVNAEDTPLAFFDTTIIHARAALDYALAQS
jgi:aspartate racemase